MLDLIKKFFDTFEIEPYDRYYNCKESLEGECKAEKSCCVCENSVDAYCYPEITDHILIELYCNLCNAFNLLNVERYPVFVFNTKDFKKFVLKELIWVEEFFKNEYIKQQIQKIFKEE